MTPELSYAPRANENRILWSMKIDPKLKALATDAAQDEGISLAGFIENSIRLALEEKQESEANEEATPGEDVDREKLSRRSARQSRELWGEQLLWDDDKSNRFFARAIHRFDLLTEPEKRFWQLFVGYSEHVGHRITAKAFREFWNSPSINTSHLEEDGK
ncbi:MAG TPA: hypothetical protein VHZ28_13585 [Terracidiphilus sp.]|jgi:hypothetical protein|nr:hypothetical protein [Terracidiphilus sp.]